MVIGMSLLGFTTVLLAVFCMGILLRYVV